METKTITVNVYSFEELPKKIQDKLINDTITFYLEAISFKEYSPIMQKAVLKAERLHTPWFSGSYIWDDCKDEIMQNIALNGPYLSNGDSFGTFEAITSQRIPIL